MVINETILRFHQTWQGHLQSKWKLDVCREHQLWRILQSAMVNYLRVHGMLPFCYFSIAMEKKTVATIAIGKSTFMGHFPWLCQIIRGINIYSLQWRSDWWFGTFFPYIGNYHPNWRSHIFQRGRHTTNQMKIVCGRYNAKYKQKLEDIPKFIQPMFIGIHIAM